MASLFLVPASAQAEEESFEQQARQALASKPREQFLTITEENDLFGAGTDQHYTNGVRFGWLDTSATPPKLARYVGDNLPFFSVNDTTSVYYSAGQNLYTPRNILASTPDPHDRPYAAFLYGSVGMATAVENHLDSIELTAGVVGPLAMGEGTQKFVHRLINADHPGRGGEPGLTLEVPFEGRVWRGRELLDLVVKLYADHHVTAAARDGLRWLVEHTETAGGRLDLRGERFAILGAAAELSPAPLLLAAGATVLWIDRVGPERMLAERQGLAGTVIHVPAGDDLLGAPRVAQAAIRRFAEEGEGPVHVGLVAYALGASRELRIAAVMDALVKALGPKIVKSLSLFISPTSPGEMQPEDRQVARVRLATPPFCQKALATSRVLFF